jgi:hypothetical protein
MGGVLSGAGTIDANLVNSGQVNPGGDGGAGVLTIHGNYTETATGVLNIVIGGDTPATGYGQLMVAGSATLDGMLNVSLGNGFTPTSGEAFPILTFTSLNGMFARTSIDPAFMDPPNYDPMDVTVVAN